MPRAKGQSSLAKNQLQLAIALSSSLEESKTRELLKLTEELPADAIEDGAVPHNIKQMQKEFLERLQPKPISGPARRARKVVSAAIPTLLSRSSEERLRIITEKVALVLIKDDYETDYPVTRATKPCVHGEESNKENILWQKASEVLADNDRQSYYVDSLSVYLCPEQSEMNGWRDVRPPGRSSARRVECSPASPFMNLDEQGESETPFWHWLHGHGVSAEKDKMSHELQMDWARLVNRSIMSDVSINIMGQEMLWAHKLVLKVRCPTILSELQDGIKLQWSDATRCAALAFLALLYTGRLVPVRFLSSRADCFSFLNLARNYGFTKLFPKEYLVVLEGEESVDDLQDDASSLGNASTDLFAGMDESSVPTCSLSHQQSSSLLKDNPDETVWNQAVSSPSTKQRVNRLSASSTPAEVITLDSDEEDDKLVHGFFGSCMPPPLPLTPCSPVSTNTTTVLDTRPQPSVSLPEQVPSDERNAGACEDSVEQYCSESPLDLSFSSSRVSISPGRVSMRRSQETASQALHETPRKGINTFVRKQRCDGKRSSQDVEVIVLDDDVEVPVYSKRKLGGSEEEDLVDSGTTKKPCTGEVPAWECMASPSPTSVGRASVFSVCPDKWFEDAFRSFAEESGYQVPTNCANRPSTSRRDLSVNSHVDEQVLSHTLPSPDESHDFKPVLTVETDKEEIGTLDDSFFCMINDSFLNRNKRKDSTEEVIFSTPLRTPPESHDVKPVLTVETDQEEIGMLDDSFVCMINDSFLNRKPKEVEEMQGEMAFATPLRTPLTDLKTSSPGNLFATPLRTPLTDLKTSSPGTPFATPLRTPLTDVKTSSPVTPMPNYGDMCLERFHEHLIKYGLKGNLSRHQGRQLLEHIYRTLHPLVEVMNVRGKQLFVPLGDEPPARADAGLLRPPRKLRIVDQAETATASTSHTATASTSHTATASTTHTATASTSHTATSSSSNEDVELAAETLSHPDAEQARQQGIIDLNEELRKWIVSQPDLHESALQYDPLVLNTTLIRFKKHLNGNRAVTLLKLMRELDQNCIMFRAMQQVAGNSRRRKSPKKSSKKGSVIAEEEESDY